MERYEFKLPDIGEGVTEGEVVQWLVKAGDVVKENDPMVEVMTDKATVTITAPKSGKIAELRANPGQVVLVHSVLVVFDLGGGDGGGQVHRAEAKAPIDAPKPAEPAATAVGDIKEDLPGMAIFAASEIRRAPSGPAPTPGYFNAKPLATPATRRLARELGLDLRTITPSGAHGRVTREDVRRPNMPSSGATAASPVSTSSQAANSAPAPQEKPLSVVVSPDETRAPLRGVRKRIFDGMSRSKRTAAHFTFVEECEVSELIALRDRLRAPAEAAGTKLTFLPFITKAVVAALKRHPSLNSAFDEATQEIVTRRRIHIGIASSTDAGLMVPVVRDADTRSILSIAGEIQRLGRDAKTGKIRPEDLGGSTFTITSLGAKGGLFATPILNFPEVGILGVHQIKERPVVKNGAIVIGQVMLLSLSFDHRIIDGHVGAAFAYDIIDYLQNPDRLFLEL